jgi:hypothetical protein
MNIIFLRNTTHFYDPIINCYNSSSGDNGFSFTIDDNESETYS